MISRTPRALRIDQSALEVPKGKFQSWTNRNLKDFPCWDKFLFLTGKYIVSQAVFRSIFDSLGSKVEVWIFKTFSECQEYPRPNLNENGHILSMIWTWLNFP